MRPRALRAAAVTAVTAAVLAASGCGAQEPVWSPVALPGDASPVTITAYRDDLLVGTQPAGMASSPGLLRLRGDTISAVPVTPATGYGREAVWRSLAVGESGDLVAVGGVRGGAHANVRWTVWRGNAAAELVEQEQPFSTFGGWGAGELVGAVVTAAGPAIIGSWESGQAALDAAVWLPEGTRWVRQDSTGTALASTPEALVGPTAVISDGTRILVSGSVVQLQPGAVRTLPAVWRSGAGATGWVRTDLPSAGRSGEAGPAACRSGTCTVVGQVDQRLVVWRVGTTAETVAGIPETFLDEGAALPAPAFAGEDTLLAVPERSDNRLLRERGGQWSTFSGPEGRVSVLAVVDRTAYAVAADGSGVSRLWRAAL